MGGTEYSSRQCVALAQCTHLSAMQCVKESPCRVSLQQDSRIVKACMCHFPPVYASTAHSYDAYNEPSTDRLALTTNNRRSCPKSASAHNLGSNSRSMLCCTDATCPTPNPSSKKSHATAHIVNNILLAVSTLVNPKKAACYGAIFAQTKLLKYEGRPHCNWLPQLT